MKILIYGAGVIGQIYAARLHEAGHEVTMLARGQTLQALIRDGITLVNQARLEPPVHQDPVRVEATGEVGPDRSFELVLVTVRRDQVEEILPALAGLPARQLVMMQNSPDLAHVSDTVGRDRTLFGFPGVGGYRRDDGAISYIEIPQQPTTLGWQQGREDVAGAIFRSAGFAVSMTADIDGWLKTHAVFIAATCASINSCGGDAVKLATDRKRVATMIRAAGEGFRALARQGVTVQPRPLKMIFTIVPRVIAVRYWQGQLRGALGTVALAPHSRMTKDTELPVLYRDVQKMVTGMVPDPAPGQAASPGPARRRRREITRDPRPGIADFRPWFARPGNGTFESVEYVPSLVRYAIGSGPGDRAGQNRRARTMKHITGTALRMAACVTLAVIGLALLAGKDDIRRFHRMHGM